MLAGIKSKDAVVRAYATHPDLKLIEDRVAKVNSHSIELKQHS